MAVHILTLAIFLISVIGLILNKVTVSAQKA